MTPRQAHRSKSRRAQQARDEMEVRVTLLVAAGREAMDTRVQELAARRGLGAEEWCALKLLGGDFVGLGPVDAAERSDVSAFENEGGRSLEDGEESACDRADCAIIREALRAVRGGF